MFELGHAGEEQIALFLLVLGCFLTAVDAIGTISIAIGVAGTGWLVVAVGVVFAHEAARFLEIIEDDPAERSAVFFENGEGAEDGSLGDILRLSDEAEVMSERREDAGIGDCKDGGGIEDDEIIFATSLLEHRVKAGIFEQFAGVGSLGAGEDEVEIGVAAFVADDLFEGGEVGEALSDATLFLYPRKAEEFVDGRFPQIHVDEKGFAALAGSGEGEVGGGEGFAFTGEGASKESDFACRLIAEQRDGRAEDPIHFGIAGGGSTAAEDETPVPIFMEIFLIVGIIFFVLTFGDLEVMEFDFADGGEDVDSGFADDL